MTTPTAMVSSPSSSTRSPPLPVRQGWSSVAIVALHGPFLTQGCKSNEAELLLAGSLLSPAETNIKDVCSRSRESWQMSVRRCGEATASLSTNAARGCCSELLMEAFQGWVLVHLSVDVKTAKESTPSMHEEEVRITFVDISAPEHRNP